MPKKLCELVGDGEILPDPDWRRSPHFHSTHHEAILILSGSMLLRTGENEVVAQAGNVLFYEQGLVHEEISMANDPVHTLFLAFRSDVPLSSLPLRQHDSHGRLRQLFSWIIRDRRLGRPNAACLPLLRALISELQWIAGGPRNPWLDGVLAYMRQNSAKALSLPKIARQAGMSRFAFIRKFKRLVGRTPMEELRHMRVNEARNLILSSSLPLKSIAPAVGLGDEYHLSKVFRRHFGVAPGEMRTPRARTSGRGRDQVWDK